MLVRMHKDARERPSSRELDALAGESVFCSEFKYRPGTEIFGEAEPAENMYQVIDGAVRSYRLLLDGRRQINAFHLPGDIFGVENANVHRFTAEAIIETTTRLARRQSIFGGAARGDATNNVLKLITRNLQHAEGHLLLLGRKTSVEKVAAFLIEMDRRLTAAGVMILPMNRRDIADYLGLTLETVSRALSLLKDQGTLTFIGQTQRQIELLDRRKLTELDS
jgi:CRP/FNR family transcriptional regulator, nitrogen fixation regulation protein